MFLILLLISGQFRQFLRTRTNCSFLKYFENSTLFFNNLSVRERSIWPFSCAGLCLNFSFSSIQEPAFLFPNNPTSETVRKHVHYCPMASTPAVPPFLDHYQCRLEERNKLRLKWTENSYWEATECVGTISAFYILFSDAHWTQHSALNNKWYHTRPS